MESWNGDTDMRVTAIINGRPVEETWGDRLLKVWRRSSLLFVRHHHASIALPSPTAFHLNLTLQSLCGPRFASKLSSYKPSYVRTVAALHHERTEHERTIEALKVSHSMLKSDLCDPR